MVYIICSFFACMFYIVIVSVVFLFLNSYFKALLGIKPWASYLLNKHSPTVLYYTIVHGIQLKCFNF